MSEKKPTAPAVPAHVPTAALHWYMFEVWKETAIHITWDGATVNMNSSLVLYLSSINRPIQPTGSTKYASGPGWTGGVVDLNYWVLQSGFTFTGAAASAKGSEMIPVAIHGAAMALTGITYTAATDSVAMWISGYN